MAESERRAGRRHQAHVAGLAEGDHTRQIGYVLSRSAFADFKKRVDYSEYGGAPLLGVGRPVVVGHVRSSPKAVCNAVLMAARFAREGLVPRIEQELLDTVS